MASAPRALQIGDTMYRLEEISWISFQRLTLYEQVAKWSLLAAGLLFFVMVGLAKGTFLNLEGVLALMPLLVSVQISGANRLASSGDLEEGYLERRMSLEATPARLAPLVKAHNSGMLELADAQNGYHYFIQASRIAWASPWTSINLGPLWMVATFAGYFVLLYRGVHLPDIAPLNQVHLFEFAGGDGLVQALTLLNVLLGLGAVAASFKSGLRLAAVGGLTDGLPLTRDDRRRLAEYLSSAGAEPARPAETTAVVPDLSAPPALATSVSAEAAPSAGG